MIPVLLGLGPCAVHGQTQYKRSARAHWPIWTIGGAAGVAAWLIDDHRTPPAASSMHRANIFQLDYQLMPEPRHWAAALSDPLLCSALLSGGAMACLANDSDWRTGALLWGGTLVLTGGLTHLTKVLVRRPRPSAYALLEAGESLPRDEFRSFFSGHSALALASVVSGSVLWLNWRESAWALPGASIALAAGCALSRIYAGRHFFTDVLVGAAAGVLWGMMVPNLLEREVGSVPDQRSTYFHMQFQF